MQGTPGQGMGQPRGGCFPPFDSMTLDVTSHDTLQTTGAARQWASDLPLQLAKLQRSPDMSILLCAHPRASTYATSGGGGTLSMYARLTNLSW